VLSKGKQFFFVILTDGKKKLQPGWSAITDAGLACALPNHVAARYPNEVLQTLRSNMIRALHRTFLHEWPT
jgi:hypothetical protein